MNIEELKKKGYEVFHLDIGDKVICDYCDKDYSDSDEEGGILFQSKAICPKCAPDTLVRIKKYKEEKFIRGYCPEGMSFKDWVLSIR